MAYFANGTEGMIFEETYCLRCVFYDKEENGCPIWNAHLLFAYGAEGEAREILDMLIEDIEEKDSEGHGYFSHRCKFFIPKKR